MREKHVARTEKYVEVQKNTYKYRKTQKNTQVHELIVLML